MIEIKSMNKYFDVGETKFQALKNVNFILADGEMAAIQGRSGAGKSTLLNIIGCLDNFDDGSYLLDGVNVKTQNDRQLAALRNNKIGFILQNFSLINQKSVLFNVMLPMYFSKTPYFQMKNKAMEALHILDIADQAKKDASKLSGGQRQRVAIARALVIDPQIILADEPTGALDSKTADVIMNILNDLNQKGITILIVTHDDGIAGSCRKHYMMEDGMLYEK